MSSRRILWTVPLLLLWLAARIRAEESAPSGKLFIFDEGDHQLVTVDSRTGSILARSPAVPTPTRLARTPDGRRIFLLCPGIFLKTDESGNQIASKAGAVLLDGDTLKQIAMVELGAGLGEWTFDRPGKRLAVLCPGSSEAGPTEITVLSTETGEVQGRVKLERLAQNLDLAPDGQTLAVFFTRTEEGTESELRFIDLSSLQTVGSLLLEGAPLGPVLSADGQRLYFVEPGKPHNKRAKNLDGKISIVSLTKRSLEKTLNAGSRPRGPWVDSKGRLLLLCDLPEDDGGKKPEGELRVVAGDELKISRVASSPRAIRLSEDSSRAYVAGPLQISTVDLESLQTTAQTDADTGAITGFAVSPDGRRAYVSYRNAERLAVVDLESHKLLDRMNLGRAGMRLVSGGAVGLIQMEAFSAATRATAGRSGQVRPYYAELPSKGPSDGWVVARSDGKVAFALNPATQDMTLVDDTAKTLDHIHVGHAATLFRLGGGDLIAACDNSELYLFDARTRALEEVKDFGSINAVRFSPDRARLLFLGTKKTLFLDTTTGKPAGEVKGLKNPTQVAF